MNAVDQFFILSGSRDTVTYKEPKHETQNWFTTNNNHSQNCDIIRFAY